MAGTNLISGIVKVLETPKQTLINKTIPKIEFRAQIPQIKNNRFIDLVFWGNLGEDVMNYYKLNDYIIIEGYLSIKNNDYSNVVTSKSKRIQITALKVYPFLLSSDHLVDKG